MNEKKRSKVDPVIEEVRRIRAQIWSEAGGTPEGLIRLLDERQAKTKVTHPRVKKSKYKA